MSHTAIVFPGQGSQSLGMLAEFGNDPLFQACFQEASDVLNYDVWQLTQIGPESKLNQSEFTQPALLTASVALWKYWHSSGRPLEKVILAGHSLGEYTALVCARALSFKDAVQLVRERGRLMQEAVPEGTGSMAAVLGLDDAEVEAICKQVQAESELNLCVAPANYNCPSQVVISGSEKAVQKAIEKCKEKGAKRALVLPVSVPSHCALMKPAAEKFKSFLAATPFKIPELPVLHNVDVSQKSEVNDIRHALYLQFFSPVRWTETVLKMKKMGVQTILECGPGKVLTGLNRRICPNLNCRALHENTERETVCL